MSPAFSASAAACRRLSAGLGGIGIQRRLGRDRGSRFEGGPARRRSLSTACRTAPVS
jgi:hypothetical protein